jgi:hypothetical protein
MGSGNLLGASSRFGARLYKPDEDQIAKLKVKKNKEVEAEMINDVKIEAALKVKKLLLLGEIEFCSVNFLLSVSALLYSAFCGPSKSIWCYGTCYCIRMDRIVIRTAFCIYFISLPVC